MHGYEITQLAAEAEERTGDRLRKIYAITEEGRAELNVLLPDALGRPPHGVRSAPALAAAWIHLLPANAAEILDADERLLRRLHSLVSGHDG
ncbi:hypothetical protein ACFFMN_29060 [Planobispora siamensis]|uniref:Uncharacterized protein n=1 Tax=Planobispora siamensis TaxID=936338 RepID=A0A8J3SFY0_9ACTN|nr:hypothetical protein [Planobispora siamensis]GIH91765.1 hypothetical protein Psi01_23950 [Planobispora siamensis]